MAGIVSLAGSRRPAAILKSILPCLFRNCLHSLGCPFFPYLPHLAKYHILSMSSLYAHWGSIFLVANFNISLLYCVFFTWLLKYFKEKLKKNHQISWLIEGRKSINMSHVPTQFGLKNNFASMWTPPPTQCMRVVDNIRMLFVILTKKNTHEMKRFIN